MSRFTPRFHLHQAQKRTTVSLDATLVTLLALKREQIPGSSQAHHAIRQWLQQRLDELNDPGLYQVSQWLVISVWQKSRFSALRSFGSGTVCCQIRL